MVLPGRPSPSSCAAAAARARSAVTARAAPSRAAKLLLLLIVTSLSLRASVLGGELPRELLVGHLQVFGNDARLADDRDEVGVADPSWDDVQVKVLLDPRARRLAEVQADVVTIGPVHGV